MNEQNCDNDDLHLQEDNHDQADSSESTFSSTSSVEGGGVSPTPNETWFGSDEGGRRRPSVLSPIRRVEAGPFLESSREVFVIPDDEMFAFSQPAYETRRTVTNESTSHMTSTNLSAVTLHESNRHNRNGAIITAVSSSLPTHGEAEMSTTATPLTHMYRENAWHWILESKRRTANGALTSRFHGVPLNDTKFKLPIDVLQQPWEEKDKTTTEPYDLSRKMLLNSWQQYYNNNNNNKINRQRQAVSASSRLRDNQNNIITALDFTNGAESQSHLPSPYGNLPRRAFQTYRFRVVQEQDSEFQSMSLAARKQKAEDVLYYRSHYGVGSKHRCLYHVWKAHRPDPQPHASHVQLRHLIVAISATDVIYANNTECCCLNSVTGRVVYVHGRRPRNIATGIDSLHANYGFVATGFFDSRVTVSDLGPHYEFLNEMYNPYYEGSDLLGQRSPYPFRRLSQESNDYFNEFHDHHGYTLFDDDGNNNDDDDDNLEGIGTTMIDDVRNDNQDDVCGEEPHTLSNGLLDLKFGWQRRRLLVPPLINDPLFKQPHSTTSTSPISHSRTTGQRNVNRDVSTLWRGRKVLDRHKVSQKPSEIVNCVVLERTSGSYMSAIPNAMNVSLYTACNDSTIAEWTLEGREKWKVQFPQCTNILAISPSKRMICVGSDSKDVTLIDAVSGRPCCVLHGHLDFTFSCDWHPDPNSFLLATGNQDETCRIWDIRYPKASLFVLGAAGSEIRSVKFSPDGQTLACLESQDVVALYDTASQFQAYTVADFFGCGTGISFSPDSSRFFIGVGGGASTNGAIIELRKGKPKSFIESGVYVDKTPSPWMKSLLESPELEHHHTSGRDSHTTTSMSEKIGHPIDSSKSLNVLSSWQEEDTFEKEDISIKSGSLLRELIPSAEDRKRLLTEYLDIVYPHRCEWKTASSLSSMSLSSMSLSSVSLSSMSLSSVSLSSMSLSSISPSVSPSTSLSTSRCVFNSAKSSNSSSSYSLTKPFSSSSEDSFPIQQSVSSSLSLSKSLKEYKKQLNCAIHSEDQRQMSINILKRLLDNADDDQVNGFNTNDRAPANDRSFPYEEVLNTSTALSDGNMGMTSSSSISEGWKTYFYEHFGLKHYIDEYSSKMSYDNERRSSDLMTQSIKSHHHNAQQLPYYLRKMLQSYYTLGCRSLRRVIQPICSIPDLWVTVPHQHISRTPSVFNVLAQLQNVVSGNSILNENDLQFVLRLAGSSSAIITNTNNNSTEHQQSNETEPAISLSDDQHDQIVRADNVHTNAESAMFRQWISTVVIGHTPKRYWSIPEQRVTNDLTQDLIVPRHIASTELRLELGKTRVDIQRPKLYPNVTLPINYKGSFVGGLTITDIVNWDKTMEDVLR